MANIKDVARLAGVSVATVSRALAKPEVVAEATRARVQKAVRASGYVPNTLARNFRRRRSNSVLVLVPDIANPFYSSIIRGIERVALQHHYRILLGDTQNETVRERAYTEMVTQRHADGIICLGMSIPFATRKGRRTVDPTWPPMVMACEYHGEIPVPTVCIDNTAAAVEAVRHLIDLGHRDIAFINGPENSPLCQDRLEGYCAALAAAGIRAQRHWLRSGDFSLDSGREQMRSILGAKGLPTAVFCANDDMAIGAMQEARTRGMTLPQDLSVMGFDDIAYAAFSSPALSTVRQPREQIGMAAMQLIIEEFEQGHCDKGRIVLSHELVVRESTTAPRSR